MGRGEDGEAWGQALLLSLTGEASMNVQLPMASFRPQGASLPKSEGFVWARPPATPRLGLWGAAALAGHQAQHRHLTLTESGQVERWLGEGQTSRVKAGAGPGPGSLTVSFPELRGTGPVSVQPETRCCRDPPAMRGGKGEEGDVHSSRAAAGRP